MPVPSESLSPPELLGRVAAGDAGATRDCVDRYGALVYALARRFEPAGGTDVEDAVQEIFVDLWKSASRFDAAIASESTFVAMIARRRLIERRRRRDRRPVLDPIAAAPILADPGSRPETQAEASHAAQELARLRPEQREVVVLATCHGLSHDEIAAQTGLPLGTVKAHVRRGLSSIRAALLGVQPEKSS